MAALVKPARPRELVHVAALDRDVAVDADGRAGVDIWHMRWEARAGNDLRMYPVDEATLLDMQRWCPVTGAELASALPLSDALLSAGGTDERLWVLASPPGSSRWPPLARDEPAAEAHARALSRPLAPVAKGARLCALARADRVFASLSSTMAEASAVADLLSRLDVARQGPNRDCALVVFHALLDDALAATPATAAGRRVRALGFAVRQPGPWPTGPAGGPTHHGLVGASKLLRNYGDRRRPPRLWCDPGLLAGQAVRYGIPWGDLRDMLDIPARPAVPLTRRFKPSIPGAARPVQPPVVAGHACGQDGVGSLSRTGADARSDDGTMST